MPNDTTLQSVFDYAKQSPDNTVLITYVEHWANEHPPNMTDADMVIYVHGGMQLSQDKKTLSCELKLWRNKDFQGSPGFDGKPAVPPDMFADGDSPWTQVVIVNDSGQVSLQRKLNGQPSGGLAPMNATYNNGLFVEQGSARVKSLSFSLA